MPTLLRYRLHKLLVLLGLALLGCGSHPRVSPSEDGHSFESADPTDSGGDRGAEADGSGGASASASNTGSSTTGATAGGSLDNGSDAERTIEEADIVKLVGGTLYAMSRYGGVSTVDVSDLGHLRLLGRLKIEATPFEMYVRDGVILALYRDWGEYVFDDENDSYSWVQTSNVVAIDASDPSKLAELARFPISGIISDSRIVGDVLYVASYEDGYCWGCTEERPKTTVVSLDVSQPSKVSKVDELDFEESQGVYSWQRSLSATDQRLYVAGPTWGGGDQPTGSTIQVVDISDPAGALELGASVEVSGQINSRWQMEEYDGVLRVISQPFAWALNAPPKVETFDVVSSKKLDKLGELALELPRQEQLQSVRFDGDRGYAITFEQTDPLFTIDLSDPENPVQAGELAMPGWLYYMEPRGERLLGLGYDQGNEAGALTVSLFDVSDLSKPRMLDRVNFGGDWAWLGEDQDRIHKAFRVLDEAELILMPFSGWDYAKDAETGEVRYECSGGWQSGIQLIDWSQDRLELAGVAPTQSDARRALLHDSQLLAISDDRVEAFDIADHNSPVGLSDVALAQYVSRTVGAGDSVVRIGQNWYSQETEVDVTPLEEVDVPRAGPALEVAPEPSDSCYGYSYLMDAFSDDRRAFLVYDVTDASADDYREEVRITTVDVSNPSEPKVSGSTTLASVPSYGYYDYQLPGAGKSIVQVGQNLVFNHEVYEWVPKACSDYPGCVEYRRNIVESGIKLVDLSDPAKAKTRSVDLPAGLGSTALVQSGAIVARSHYEQGKQGYVRFYLDRVDVSDPENPLRLPSINTPGAVVALSGSRALSVDYRYVVDEGVTAEECYNQYNQVVRFDAPGNYDYSKTPGTCTSLVQRLRLLSLDDDQATLLGSEPLMPDESVLNLAVGDGVVFATLGSYYYYGAGVADCIGCWYPVGANKTRLLSIGGLDSGELAVGRLEIDDGDYWSGGQLVASGKRAALTTGWRGKLSIVDADDARHPSVVREAEVNGYVSQLSVVGDRAVAAMGYDGVQSIALGD